MLEILKEIVFPQRPRCEEMRKEGVNNYSIGKFVFTDGVFSSTETSARAEGWEEIPSLTLRSKTILIITFLGEYAIAPSTSSSLGDFKQHHPGNRSHKAQVRLNECAVPKLPNQTLKRPPSLRFRLCPKPGGATRPGRGPQTADGRRRILAAS